MLWAYMSFSQYLITWSGNLTEEIPWYLRRSVGIWWWFALALIVFHFFLPFFLLLSREPKRQYESLVEDRRADPVHPPASTTRWLILPALPASNPLRFWAVVPAFVGIGGLWAAVFTRQLKSRPLVPRHDPLLAAVLDHHGAPPRMSSRCTPHHAAQTPPGPGPEPGYETSDAGHPAAHVRGRPDRRPGRGRAPDARVLSPVHAERPKPSQPNRRRPTFTSSCATSAGPRTQRSRATAGSIARRAWSGSRSTGRSTWWPSRASRRQGARRPRSRSTATRRRPSPRPVPAPRRRHESAGEDGTETMNDDRRLLALVLLVASLPLTAAAREPAPTPSRDAGRRRPACSSKVGFDQNLDARCRSTCRSATSGPSGPARRLLRPPAGDPDLVYYECPMLCNEVLNSLLRRLNALTFDVGKEFDVVTVSIDPGETPALAARKKARVPEAVRPQGGRAGLALPHRRRGVDPPAGRGRRVPLRLRPQTDQYAHPAGIVIADPEGGSPATIYGDQLPGQRPPARADRGVGRQDRLADRPDPADVLPLRPEDGQVQLRRHDVIRLLGVRDAGGPGDVHVRDAPSGPPGDRQGESGAPGPGAGLD